MHLVAFVHQSVYVSVCLQKALSGLEQLLPVSHPSPNQEPTNSKRELVCGDWYPSGNTSTNHPIHFLV